MSTTFNDQHSGKEPRGMKKQLVVTMWIMAEKNSAGPFMYDMKNTAPAGWPRRIDKKRPQREQTHFSLRPAVRTEIETSLQGRCRRR
jgi:hypothetical protein